ncbi:PREDICTED: probable glycosyltransferase At3g07620 isoform X2 [Nelumbo nucifera]|uniref:Probable glycosyltransferase At3g07620 isoform X2 n=1 Tax=Nelumbo nucifera TaxID=4432 RepID=A0A1U8Q4N9_NELNU|nr:PREDICTED: probable glycosyltransferase At3g07620 isoform X2 [Nelumbo nucifera]
MAYALQYKKLCQVETRRRILVIGIIGAATLVFQFLSLSHGNFLLSMLPAIRGPLLGKRSFPIEDSSPTHMMIGNLTLSNDVNFMESSLVLGMVKASVMEKQKEDSNETKDMDRDQKNDYSSEEAIDMEYNLEFDEDQDSYNETSFGKAVDPVTNFKLGSVNNPGSDSILEKARETEHVLAIEESKQKVNDLSSNSTLRPGISLVVEKHQTLDTGMKPPPPKLAPETSLNETDLLRKLDKNSRVSIMSSPSNLVLVSNQVTETLPKDNKPEILQSGSIALSKNSTTINIIIKKNGGTPTISISQMNSLLFQNRVSFNSKIENAPIVRNDPELHVSVFRNLSTFKRSYQLMERMLKVYIYREGEKPIFHQPNLKGIYASEGWFMKLMEGNKQFVVKDPRKAHLFYLPFSSQIVRTILYTRENFHGGRNLALYLKKYVDTVAAKYHFWNRTDGADHFLVACHDWAPRITRHHMSKCIRALCNTNIARGFQIGKDVSLPVTSVRSMKNPLRYLGGKPPSERPTLAFFAGSMHGYLRPILLQYWENKDPEMKIFGPMPRDIEGKMNYIEHMRSSKYCICARGYEVHTPRVVEAIFYECVPVIISDNYVPPFFEVLDWEAFAVFIAEKDIPNLKNILLSIPEEVYLAMQLRVKKVQQHFLWHSKPVKYDIFHMTLHSIWSNRIYQI